jgi:hypothetical protein
MVTRSAARRAPGSSGSASATDPDEIAEAGTGALERLLDAERDFIERVAAADRTAEAILSQAREAADRREQEFARELEREIAALRGRLAADAATEAAETEAAAARDAARFDGMSDARIATFAGSMLEELFEPGDGTR